MSVLVQFCVGLIAAAIVIILSGLLTGPVRALVARFGIARVVADALVFIAALAGGLYLIFLFEKFKHGG